MTEKERLIDKLFRGQCSREELEALLDQMQRTSSEENSEVMEKLWQQLATFPELEHPLADRLVEKTLQKIEKRTVADNSRPVAEMRKLGSPGRNRQFIRRWGIAAAILLLVGLISWLWLLPTEMINMQTAYGQQTTIVLPDDSRVTLNANSTIRYRKRWNQREDRQVWLSGEAYFEVRKNEEQEQKFRVITPDLTVEVLGTVFNVNTRQDETMVFLEEGRINLELEANSRAIMMDPGELVTYSKKTRQPERTKVETEAPASWKDGTILLQNVSLQTISQKMEEIYGVSFQIHDRIPEDQSFYFPMPISNLDTALLLLRESTGLQVEKIEDRVMIREAATDKR